MKQDMDGVFVVESTDLAVTLALRHIQREHSIRRKRGSNFIETVHFSSPLCELRLCLTAYLLCNTDAAMLVVLHSIPANVLTNNIPAMFHASPKHEILLDETGETTATTPSRHG